MFPLLASAIALTHPFLDGAFLAISLFPEYHPDALILFQSVKLASIKPKNPLLFYSLKTNVMTVLLITHPGIPNIYAVPTVKGYIGSIVP